MKQLRLFMIMSFLGMTVSLAAQDLGKHRWKDRIIMVYTQERESKQLKQQVDELASDMEGFRDRKLIIYIVSDGFFKEGIENGKWQKRSNDLDDIFQAEEKFEVVLLGLDGGVKLRQDQLLTREKLYSTIDAMPMRRNELRNRK